MAAAAKKEKGFASGKRKKRVWSLCWSRSVERFRFRDRDDIRACLHRPATHGLM
jgi:hypothetical protein